MGYWASVEEEPDSNGLVAFTYYKLRPEFVSTDNDIITDGSDTDTSVCVSEVGGDEKGEQDNELEIVNDENDQGVENKKHSAPKPMKKGQKDKNPTTPGRTRFKQGGVVPCVTPEKGKKRRNDKGQEGTPSKRGMCDLAFLFHSLIT